MNMIRRRIARLFENMIAFCIGAVIICLANGMSPAEIVDLALTNAHKLPAAVPDMVSQIFAAGFLG
ncbi:hypothetical protein [Parvularcula marina]|uniref:Uncharacterized protein n=1 Tax=Parvularcula marina TaxID=2292771 RepID=A0A371RHG9_9PROT|nr:hypothetical protein [Parvularcula marina]RFB04881.1 hypothetical protein DX908_06045 [Parvularcula marina]